MLGFGFNKTKVLAAAERHLQQGRLHQAIAEYQKILKHDARDLTVLNTVGDLYARGNQVSEATACFREVADAYAQSGFVVKAIAVYKKLSKLNPGNVEYGLKLGELYRNQGLHNDARTQYLQAAELLLRAGNLEEGSQLFEKILEIDPDNITAQSRLAELYMRHGKKSQATEMLFRLAETALRRQSLEAADQALGRLTTLVPEDPRLAEFHAKLALERGNPAAAAKFLESVPALQSSEAGLQSLAKVYFQGGQIAKAIPVAKRLLGEFGNSELLAECCDRLLAPPSSGSSTDADFASAGVKEALAIYEEFSEKLLSRPGTVEKLQDCVAAVRQDPQALESLRDLLQKAGDTSGDIELLELAAQGWARKGELARAAGIYQRLAAMDPQNPGHMRNYQQIAARIQPPPAVPGSANAASAVADHELAAIVEQSAGGYPDELEAQIQSAITDAELLDKHQNPQKAIATLEPVLADAPFEPRLNQLLLGLYRRVQRFSDAAACCEKLEQVLSLAGRQEQAQEYAQLAAQYRGQAASSPGWSDTAAPSGSAAAPPASKTPTMIPLTAGFDHFSQPGAEELDISEEWEQISGKSAGLETPPVSTQAPRAAAASEPEQVKQIAEEIRFYLAESLLREAEFAVQKLAELDPSNFRLPGFREQLAAKRAGQAAGAPAETGAQAGRGQELEFAAGPARNLDEPPPASTEENLDQFVGDLERSLGIDFPFKPNPATGVAPASAGAAAAPQRPSTPPPPPASYAEVARVAGASPPAPAAGVETARTAGVAAPASARQAPAAAMAGAASAESSALSDVFQEFKAEMEAGTAKDDPEIHYNLGLAFKEMGLLDEAIGEFQQVCQAIDQGQPFPDVLQAYTWLAQCLVAKGAPEASFKWYERALRAAPDDAARTAIHYELAEAYEAAGRKPEALSQYMEVYGSNIDYREVAQRIKALKS
ncbi:MAG: tetratricopeptide repeat protein [Candidatus Korobacteraceae bacterium]|jgi:tetratricopeptide (TPR) repeat protein